MKKSFPLFAIPSLISRDIMKKLVAIIMVNLALFALHMPTVSADFRVSDNGQIETRSDEPQLTPAALDKLIVTVTGLKATDSVTLTLLPEPALADTDAILQQTATGKGVGEVSIDMSYPLKDGYYRLSISAPDTYFREPKAWIFMVLDAELVNPLDKSAVFKLIPPENRDFDIVRSYTRDSGNGVDAEGVTDEHVPSLSKTEWMLSLSDVPKIGIGESVLDTTDYYFGPYSSLNSTGIQGRFTVEDPGVRHGATGEIADAHIYVRNGVSSHMEIGWVERNIDADVRYMFEYDTVYGDWRLDDIPADPLEVMLEYDADFDYWFAEFKVNGSWYTWIYVDMGWTEADEEFNQGEVRTDYGDTPSFPTTTIDISKLNLNGWTWWDWQRWATTQIWSATPYHTHMYTSYYYFDIHKD